MNSDCRKYSWFALVICFVLGSAVYANSLDVPFYLDDFRNFLDNPSLRLKELSLASLRGVIHNSTLWTRPVSNISFALNYYFSQENVTGFHAVNILIHIGTGFFLYQLAFATLSTPALKTRYNDRFLIALLAAGLWLVHPLHVQSVTYIVQRMTSMAVMFYILSLWLYVEGRLGKRRSARWVWHGFSIAAGLLAVGSKEIAATLPIIVVLYEWYFFRDLDRQWLYRQVWLLAIIVLFAALLYAIYAENPIDLTAAYDKRPFTMAERLLTEFRVVMFYGSLLFFPHPGRLNLDHHVPLSLSLFDPITTSLSLAALIILLAVSIRLARSHRLLSFAILWYGINLFIESSVIGLEIIFEHRTYLPSVFVLFAVTATLYQLIRPKWAAVFLVVIAMGLCSFWTVVRNNTWRDPVVFWRDSAAKSPGKARPFINLSVAYRERGHFDDAIAAAQEAIRIDARFINGFVALGRAYLEKGETDQAITAYREALARMPEYADVYNALAEAYLKKGMVSEAREALQENLRLKPSSYEALVNLASIKAYQGSYREAITDYQRAMEIGGENPDILFNLAVAYGQAGDIPNAILTYERVLSLQPEDPEARENLEKLRRNHPASR